MLIYPLLSISPENYRDISDSSNIFQNDLTTLNCSVLKISRL